VNNHADEDDSGPPADVSCARARSSTRRPPASRSPRSAPTEHRHHHEADDTATRPTKAPSAASGRGLLTSTSSATRTTPSSARSATVNKQRSQTRQTDRVHTATAQQEASWRERAVNAEEQVRTLNHELARQRQLIADLLGQLRDSDGTWLEHDRTRLREENQRLLHERNQLIAAQHELQRRLDGARANVARLNTARVTQLFPDGPGPQKAS